jgi:hypothetical protein
MAVRFSPTIELGHIMQAIIACATLTGWGLWGYANMEAQINALHSEASLLQQRVEQDEKTAITERDDQRTRDTRIATVLDKIYDQLSDLRAAVAKSDAGRR